MTWNVWLKYKSHKRLHFLSPIDWKIDEVLCISCFNSLINKLFCSCNNLSVWCFSRRVSSRRLKDDHSIETELQKKIIDRTRTLNTLLELFFNFDHSCQCTQQKIKITSPSCTMTSCIKLMIINNWRWKTLVIRFLVLNIEEIRLEMIFFLH